MQRAEEVCGRRHNIIACRRDHMEELRCVLAVVRHGDRTPKQKMKMKITQVKHYYHPRILKAGK